MSDLIDRQAAIDAFNTNLNELVVGGEENAKTVENYLNRVLDKIKCLPSALSTNLAEVGTDCISRQTILDAIDEISREVDDGDGFDYAKWREYFCELPSAQPKRGRWIKLDMHRGMADHKCTACEQECYVPTCMGEPLYAFCPNCGSYNGGEQDE